MCGNDTAWRDGAACLISAALLAACAADAAPPDAAAESTSAAAAAIKDGYADESDRAVAGMLITNEIGRVTRTCSSTLIAPNLILTAQHCIADAPKLIACKTAAFGQPVDPSQVFVTIGDALWSPDGPWIAAREVLRPPDGNAICGRDIALVVLATSVRNTEVTPLAPRLDRPPEVSEVYSAVGFGETDGRTRDGGTRRRRDDLRIECVGFGCGTQERVAGSEWRGETGICSGDSGGPALDDAGRVIGVTSRGPAGCADPIYGGLIAHRGWLLDQAARAAAAGGYDAPSWIVAPGEVDAPPARALDDRWTSCAYAPASGDATTGAAAALALLALRARARKARADPRAS